ncbi:hypothetical protein BKA70DRAFT_485375 [Coprinopsis sp. MPI-PUGE-AT-0042]|nr:hypothetical protein BKA70DRAFT_485375 [Coprinopsis sp. MPI-PUGE-AT-0042]
MSLKRKASTHEPEVDEASWRHGTHGNTPATTPPTKRLSDIIEGTTCRHTRRPRVVPQFLIIPTSTVLQYVRHQRSPHPHRHQCKRCSSHLCTDQLKSSTRSLPITLAQCIRHRPTRQPFRLVQLRTSLRPGCLPHLQQLPAWHLMHITASKKPKRMRLPSVQMQGVRTTTTRCRCFG